MSMIKAIETTWNGYKFRSRLEARWAVYFTSLRIEFWYEPEGYIVDGEPYLPDFWLPQVDMFAEVKPAEFTAKERKKCSLLPNRCLLLVGPPDFRYYESQDKALLPYGGCDTDWYILGTRYIYDRPEGRFYNYGCDMTDPCNEFPDPPDERISQAIYVSRSTRF